MNPDLERDGISEKSSLIKTKFKKLNETTLWDKCKYFGETEDSFYVKLFLDIGKVQVGHQLFVEKMTQVGHCIKTKILHFNSYFILTKG